MLADFYNSPGVRAVWCSDQTIQSLELKSPQAFFSDTAAQRQVRFR
jgi:hypothetical protein